MSSSLMCLRKMKRRIFLVKLLLFLTIALVFMQVVYYPKRRHRQWQAGNKTRINWKKETSPHHAKTFVTTLPLVQSPLEELQNCELEIPDGEMCPIYYNDLTPCELRFEGLECPDIRTRVNGTLRQSQLVALRILRVFDAIATRYDIPYWLRGSSLLGAARHKGIVPWIVGIEVEMSSKNARAFRSRGLRDIPPEIRLHRPQTTISYPDRGSMRLEDRGSCYKRCDNCNWIGGLGVDVFIQNKVTKRCRMQFEGWFIPVPCDWERRLRAEFGENYAQIPAQRASSVVSEPFRSCDKLRKDTSIELKQK
ncbi:uncharacterized protein LOC125561740 [Nematostella vectensis]|uniref:uncharacterized protein LOC125561740 n=1 Tax=Nematostella vectensis TaxID=45351 RepID=UPI0020772781|nr:uncharacterized protein LOC125561740 [Nematostella vectensis]